MIDKLGEVSATLLPDKGLVPLTNKVISEIEEKIKIPMERWTKHISSSQKNPTYIRPLTYEKMPNFTHKSKNAELNPRCTGIPYPCIVWTKPQKCDHTPCWQAGTVGIAGACGHAYSHT